MELSPRIVSRTCPDVKLPGTATTISVKEQLATVAARPPTVTLTLAGLSVKWIPLSVRAVPGGPESGEMPVTVGASANDPALVPVPAAVVTEICPLSAPAGTSGNFALGGDDPQTGRDYVMYQLTGGGYGGSPDGDGLSNGCSTIGISKAQPVEILEQNYPVLLRHYALHEGSGPTGTDNHADAA